MKTIPPAMPDHRPPVAQTMLTEGYGQKKPFPLFYADWEDLLMVHFAVTPEVIQGQVPFHLDTFEGEAFVTFVAFRQTHLRFAEYGPWAKALTWPVDGHAFLNIRTYVKHEGLSAIFFMTEYINNALARIIGPLLYGLPYHLAKINYQHDRHQRRFRANVHGLSDQLELEAGYALAPLDAAKPDTPEFFLHERYHAYTLRGHEAMRFQVDHDPWRMHRAQVALRLNGKAFDWANDARFLGAFFTLGLRNVGLGAPQSIDTLN
ncbi:DUF2071 domain-containing protein [Rubellicoccus peritrichatus]|uniref:DUF2071 domain-containing protein n=1 Tax=Rubellicoccus peritrichatus TaxID=3080537 RepID=A0AAQ3QU26_9BACT|nr:DUF2071 domain-containing protein [Puniceicoccus sp. CR14]WOO40023.1 DUF2071 domain-containing protein [Puniceicoccus sp. CR14]